MKRFEPVVLEQRPDAVVVVGDVNSTIACALTAVKLGVPVAHVEAGLRSFDRTMPEEINRILTDAISQWLFVTERSGVENLKREGVPDERIFFVGNVMIDTLLACREQSEQLADPGGPGLGGRGGYAVLTLHRPANVDDPRGARRAAGRGRAAPAASCRSSSRSTPGRARPWTATAMGRCLRLRLTDPLGYLDFMKLVAHARLVLTDSGGIQEETTVLGVPCLTLRNNTERPVDRGAGDQHPGRPRPGADHRRGLQACQCPPSRAGSPTFGTGGPPPASSTSSGPRCDRFAG